MLDRHLADGRELFVAALAGPDVSRIDPVLVEGARGIGKPREQPASSIRCLISGTARAASGVLTVTRTMSDPASASSMHCVAVAAASAVSVIVMLCTTTGAPPPTCTEPTRTAVVR